MVTRWPHFRSVFLTIQWKTEGQELRERERDAERHKNRLSLCPDLLVSQKCTWVSICLDVTDGDKINSFLLKPV